MRAFLPILGVFLFACSSGTTADAGADATLDQGVSDTGGGDSSTGDGGGGGDSGTTDSGSDARPDGSICPPCMQGFSCCTVMSSSNYGKCVDDKCLSCCM